MLSQGPQHTSHRVWCSSPGGACVYPYNVYAALVLKKMQLFLNQHGTGNTDLTKEEKIVSDRLIFAAIF